MMERRGGGRPMNPCRDTFTADPRTKGDEVILTQRWSYETIYPSRVAEPTTISPVQIRSHAQEVKEELRRLPRVQVTRNHVQEVRRNYGEYESLRKRGPNPSRSHTRHLSQRGLTPSPPPSRYLS